MFFIVLLLIVMVAEDETDKFFIPVNDPDEVVLRLLMFCTMLLSISTADATNGPTTIPVKLVSVDVEVDNTAMLFDAAPVPELPIILLLTCDGAATLFT